MILRIDGIGVDLPPPSDPDPAGAAMVQELLGGKFGEMSTWLNYTFQSFNFRARQGARPFYDLVSSIATEEFGHVELVCATINTMLTGASPINDGRAPDAGLAGLADVGNPQMVSIQRRWLLISSVRSCGRRRMGRRFGFFGTGAPLGSRLGCRCARTTGRGCVSDASVEMKRPGARVDWPYPGRS